MVRELNLVELPVIDKETRYSCFGESELFWVASKWLFYVSGKCVNNGVYFDTLSSYVVCLRNIPYRQQCSSGYINHNFGSYVLDEPYGYQSFCCVQSKVPQFVPKLKPKKTIKNVISNITKKISNVAKKAIGGWNVILGWIWMSDS